MRNSTLVVIILLVVVAGGFFFLGSQLTGTSQPATVSTTTVTTGTGGQVTTPPDDTSTWEVFADSVFSMSYPDVFTVNQIATGDEWRAGANGDAGTLDFSITLPKSYMPNTNFDDAKLTLGHSTNTTSVADCLKPDASGGPNTSMTTKLINGVSYTVFTSSDAGAGNLYDTTSYRTVKNKTCVAVEYTIHYSQFANYPAGSITVFDESKVQALLANVVATVGLK